MQRKARDIQRSLTNKFGFAPSNRGDRHAWLELAVPGIPKISVMFSHGERDVGDKLQALIAKQLLVPKGYLDGMIDCSNSRADYVRRVVDEPYGPGARSRAR